MDRSTGKGIGIALIVLSMISTFASLNFTTLGILLSPIGPLSWFVLSRIVTRYDSPVRSLFMWLFPYQSFISDLPPKVDPRITGEIDPVTMRAMRGPGASPVDQSKDKYDYTDD